MAIAWVAKRRLSYQSCKLPAVSRAVQYKSAQIAEMDFLLGEYDF